MTIYKRFSSDFQIETIDSADNVTVSTHTLVVDGNLNVIGNVTYIESTELKVDDPFITLAANNVGSYPAALFTEQGIVAQTGTGTFAGLRFDNATSEWQISPSVAANGAAITAYSTIGTAAAGSPGGNINDIQFKAGANTFGGNSNFTFNGTDTVTIEGKLVLGNIGSVPTSVANSVILYNNQISGGGTGIFAKSAVVDDELVSKSKAILYSIIF